MFVIVPDYVNDAINRKLDDLLKDCPEADASREHLYEQLLEHYNEHGEIPDCTITKGQP